MFEILINKSVINIRTVVSTFFCVFMIVHIIGCPDEWRIPEIASRAHSMGASWCVEEGCHDAVEQIICNGIFIN